MDKIAYEEIVSVLAMFGRPDLIADFKEHIKIDEDYTQHKDKQRRSKYLTRHKKDLDRGDYKSAGYLSYYILWGASSNRNTNIKKYKKMFKLT